MGTQPRHTYLRAQGKSRFSSTGKETFAFDHNLTASPLFHLNALRELALCMAKNGSSYHLECSDSKPNSGWGTQPAGAALEHAFETIPSSSTLLLLKSVQNHPDYNQLLLSFLEELADALGVKTARQFIKPICTIIVASPERITPYHMDDAHNFLMQVHGKKTFHVFDGSDSDIVSDQERANFWNGDHNAAILTEVKQRKAITYSLEGGRGVHVPMNYPHWAQNGPDVSVAVSINFRPRRDRVSEIYRMNSLLRSRGLRPQAPGTNPFLDDFKVAAFRAVSIVRRIKEQARRTSNSFHVL